MQMFLTSVVCMITLRRYSEDVINLVILRQFHNGMILNAFLKWAQLIDYLSFLNCFSGNNVFILMYLFIEDIFFVQVLSLIP